MARMSAAFVLVALLCAPGVARAGSCTAQQFGDTSVFNCDDGSSGTAYRFGDTTMYNFSDGGSGTAYRFGNSTIYNFDEPNSGIRVPALPQVPQLGSGRQPFGLFPAPVERADEDQDEDDDSDGP